MTWSRLLDFFSVQFCRSVVSNSLWPHGLLHARPPCPQLTPRVYSNSCPLSQWCHPTISSSVVPFSSCLQSFPASGSFQMRQFFESGDQSTGASASTSVLPMNIQDWLPLGLTGLISLMSKGLSRVFSNTTVQRHQFFGTQLFLWSNSHIHTWLLEKDYVALTRQSFYHYTCHWLTGLTVNLRYKVWGPGTHTLYTTGSLYVRNQPSLI